MHRPFESVFPEELDEHEILVLPVSPVHLHMTISLPFHHRNPFDRLLIAQALVEGAALVSRDQALDAYGVPRLR
ncbi:MAG: hypothetical protein DIJKHBIC_03814 [Thermoanaerobaculia bacterium]|nr:hypothetical protein [Thermoanaerobaculia bacterium]